MTPHAQLRAVLAELGMQKYLLRFLEEEIGDDIIHIFADVGARSPA